jgi:hypothetical protein
MNVTPENSSIVSIRPPQLIQSLVGGFNAVASHIYLILLPVILDLLLWFGPHVRLKTLMEPAMLDMLAFLRQNGSQEMRGMLDGIENLYKLILEQYNLFSSLSTLPVGVPSLMVGQLPVKTPLGAAPVLEVSSYAQLFLGWLGLSLLGLVLGTIYFAAIARVCDRVMEQQTRLIAAGENAVSSPVTPECGTAASRVPAFRPGVLAWETMQVLALLILLVGILLVLMVPSLFITSLLALVSPFMAQIAMLLISFSLVWFMVPLVFSPHGIFLCGQSVLNAMFNSVRLVRYVLPGTGMFLLAVIVLNQGLGVLWRTPPDTSWMALIGIFGHAFVITGLLAASFVYYRGGLTYVQAIRKLKQKTQQ